MVSVPELPDFNGKTPKEMRRAWLRLMADIELTDELYIKAEYVRLAIEELVLNLGRDAEPTSRENLRRRFAAFSEMWSQWRG